MADSSLGGVSETKRHSWLVDFVIRLVKEKPLGTVGAVITLLLLFTGIFADFLAPSEMNEVRIGENLLAPSAKYWLGTDYLGRDMLSQIIFGARVSVIVGLAGATISAVITLFIGILSGYFGGKFDLVVQRFVDGIMCMPGLVLVMAAVSLVGASMLTLIIILGILWGIGGSRIIRSAVIGIKENVYVTAAVAIGCSTPRTLIRHILPNIMAPLVTNFTLQLPSLILTEASLSFLGYGIPPPQPSWGGMLGVTGRLYMYKAPWIAIWPGLALATVVYGINMFGDAVRDLLDPRLRGGVGRYGVRARKEVPEKSEPSTPKG